MTVLKVEEELRSDPVVQVVRPGQAGDNRAARISR